MLQEEQLLLELVQMIGVMICFSLKIQLVISTSARESKGLNYLWLHAEEAGERVSPPVPMPLLWTLWTSFASQWLTLESWSVFCIPLFSTLTFTVMPWVSGEVIEAEDGCWWSHWSSSMIRQQWGSRREKPLARIQPGGAVALLSPRLEEGNTQLYFFPSL